MFGEDRDRWIRRSTLCLNVHWHDWQPTEQVRLGYLLNSAQMYQQVDVILICIAIYAVLGLSADLIVRTLERLFMPWRAGIAVR